jgi:membrane-anchored glycerophosphoryl diester phosphodiesterase (GDPDase)
MMGAHIIVLEGLGVTDSISRSWTLTKGSKRWLFLLGLVFWLIGTVLSVIISIPIYFMGDPNVAMLEGASTGYWIFNGAVSAIAQIVVTVMGVAWSTSAYVELRKIREGVDPESQVDVFS